MNTSPSSAGCACTAPAWSRLAARANAKGTRGTRQLTRQGTIDYTRGIMDSKTAVAGVAEAPGMLVGPSDPCLRRARRPRRRCTRAVCGARLQFRRCTRVRETSPLVSEAGLSQTCVWPA
eukprot:gene22928-biopygen23774